MGRDEQVLTLDVIAWCDSSEMLTDLEFTDLQHRQTINGFYLANFK